MRHSIIFILLACVFLTCKKDDGLIQPFYDQTIRTSLVCTDTSGNLHTVFRFGSQFYLIFAMINKTGRDQNYSWTGPKSEIQIFNNDTLVSSQYPNMSWPEIINRGVLKSDSTIMNQWLVPLSPFSSMAFLPPGNYEAAVHLPIRFDDVEISEPARLPIIIYSDVVVRKPNIYLYPITACTLSISLEFPLGGSVIQSLPAYADGWNIFAEPSGRIDRQYDYLFYESKNPDLFQYRDGWIVARDTLTSFFTHTLLTAGFQQNEKNDFVEYWIPKLTDSPYYIIYPQQSIDIEKVIRLHISPFPDKVLRLFFVIKGSHQPNEILISPELPQFERTGFVAAEWGVVLK